MRERPILFSSPMVRALLAGTKTQTRRPCQVCKITGVVLPKRPYEVGDHLWVREPWRVGKPQDNKPPRDILAPLIAKGKGVTVCYVAGGWRSFGPPGRDEPVYPNDMPMPEWAGRYRHARFMPRAFSRIDLENTEIRVERLQDINEADAIAEGVERLSQRGTFWKDYRASTDRLDHYTCTSARQSYFSLWQALNGAESLNANPWVWVVVFKRIKP